MFDSYTKPRLHGVVAAGSLEVLGKAFCQLGASYAKKKVLKCPDAMLPTLPQPPPTYSTTTTTTTVIITTTAQSPPWGMYLSF